ncbi:ketoacyl-ACP synthase III family protein [Lentzea sp. NPDC004782]|uniref:ketoacyl-ACP synthase III family protein n=1 Tax=Lentzea sp. NPDC004782 TaxID=3154458 RepID=UPI0033BDDC2C
MKVGGKIALNSVALWVPEGREQIPESSCGPELPGYGLPVLRLTALPVAEIAPPEMAVLAAQSCLKQANADAADVSMLIHAFTYHQGHDAWPAAHYIADQIGATSDTVPLMLQQFCNGGLAALDIATKSLLADPDAGPVLITTADRFCPPGWHRWEKGRPGGFGDGATAALVTRSGGDLDVITLLSIAHAAAPESERSFRGDREFTPAPMWNRTSIDSPSIANMAEGGGAPAGTTEALEAVMAMRQGPRRCLEQALADAGLDVADPRIRHVVLPRIDQVLMDVMYGGVFDDLVHAEILVFGTETGHLGPGDAVANLIDLREGGYLRPGEIVVLVTVGAGWSWSTAVFEAGSGWPL